MHKRVRPDQTELSSVRNGLLGLLLFHLNFVVNIFQKFTLRLTKTQWKIFILVGVNFTQTRSNFRRGLTFLVKLDS